LSGDDSWYGTGSVDSGWSGSGPRPVTAIVQFCLVHICWTMLNASTITLASSIRECCWYSFCRRRLPPGWPADLPCGNDCLPAVRHRWQWLGLLLDPAAALTLASLHAQPVTIVYIECRRKRVIDSDCCAAQQPPASDGTEIIGTLSQGTGSSGSEAGGLIRVGGTLWMLGTQLCKATVTRHRLPDRLNGICQRRRLRSREITPSSRHCP
jgi:hypothetical protein